MAPRERRHSDPKLTLVRSAATDIVNGVFDTPAAAQNVSQPHPSPPGSQQPGHGPDRKDMKAKIKCQLEAPKESGIYAELKDSVDTYLRQQGELSDSESIVDDFEFDYSDLNGRVQKVKTSRMALVSELKSTIGPNTELLLNGKAVKNDQQTVYNLWSQQNLARHGRPYKMQQVGRCSSG